MYAPTSTDITSSFTQSVRIKTVFSTDYVDQPTVTHSLTPVQLTFTVPPAVSGATPPTQTLAASFFTVAYPIKTGTTDALGNTPPAISPLPFAGFSTASILKIQSSLGWPSLTSPYGSLNAVGFSGSLDPGSTIAFSCDPWSTTNQKTTSAKTLVFNNNVEPAFTASFVVSCAFESAVLPVFVAALTTQVVQ